jgi:ankyrin repeat protein
VRPVVRSCLLLAVGLACASAQAQTPPTAAEYSQYKGLFAAAARNDSVRIGRLIAGGEYAGIRDSHGRTPLHVATWRKSRDSVRVLSDSTGEPNVLDGDGFDIVTIAAFNNDVDTLRVVLEAGCGPTNIVGSDDTSALIVAARRGNELPVRALIRAGAMLDYIDKRGNTALIAAITGGDGSRRYVATVKALVSARADVNIGDRTGATPLALAKARGYGEMIAILQKAGEK